MYLIHLLDYSPHRGRYRVAALFFWRWALSESFLDLAKSKRWVGFRNIRLVFIEALCQSFEKDKNHFAQRKIEPPVFMTAPASC